MSRASNNLPHMVQRFAEGDMGRCAGREGNGCAGREGNGCWWSCWHGDVKDTVGVDVEGDFDLRSTKGFWWDTSEVELAEEVVVPGAAHSTS